MTGILMALGIRGVNPRRADFVECLSTLRTGTGEPLPIHTSHALVREHGRLCLLQRQIKEIEAAQVAMLKVAAQQQAEESSATLARELVRLKGIGQLSAITLSREVFYRHFANRREVASYFGLTPSPYRSGGMQSDQGISKAGNPRARNRARLAVAKASTGKRADAVVSGTHPGRHRTDPAHCGRCSCTQADSRALALCHHGPSSRRCGNESGVATSLARAIKGNQSSARPGSMCDRPYPWLVAASEDWSHRPAPLTPLHAGFWLRPATRRTGDEEMRFFRMTKNRGRPVTRSLLHSRYRSELARRKLLASRGLR